MRHPVYIKLWPSIQAIRKMYSTFLFASFAAISQILCIQSRQDCIDKVWLASPQAVPAVCNGLYLLSFGGVHKYVDKYFGLFGPHKGQIKPKAVWACHKFSQKMNKRICFVESKKQTKQIGLWFFWEDLRRVNLLSILSDLYLAKKFLYWENLPTYFVLSTQFVNSPYFKYITISRQDWSPKTRYYIFQIIKTVN